MSSSRGAGSQIFTPFRALGLCSNYVPLALSVKGKRAFVATSVGRAFHVYDCEKLQLLFVGPVQEDSITCLSLNDASVVYAAVGPTVRMFRRGRQTREWAGHGGSVHTMLLLGPQLVTIDDTNCVRVWSIGSSKELYCEIEFDKSTFEITSAVHPATYLNKILFGSRQGHMQLWNLRTNKLIYSFQGWDSPVLTMVQSPALDVIGAGLENGMIMIHNVATDETLMSFKQEWGPVLTMSFRTDGVSTLATGSPMGHVAVWDLEERKLASMERRAHRGAVTGLQFMAEQPLMITSSADNSVKTWIFDQSDGSARLLRQREGHSAPPTRVRFYTKGGLGILTSGLDNSLRALTVNKDSMNRELSQGSVIKKARRQGVKVETLKLPPIVDFDSEMTRVKEWDSVVTCHAGLKTAKTWNLSTYTLGKHSLTSRHADSGAKPRCCCVTGCGNFTIIGMSTGHVEMYNIQSGLHRGEFGSPKAHSGCVRGVVSDAVNMEIYTGAADKTVKFWSFHEKSLLSTVSLDSQVSSMRLKRESSLLAVCCDDFSIHVIDTDTRRIVRSFKGHYGRITDMCFSPDSRWLVTTAMDCTVRTWDLPTARLLDCYLVEAPATSLSFSPTGEFLATTHVDDLGVFLWTNRTLYSPVSLRPLPSSHLPSLVELPSTQPLSTDKENEEREEEEQEEEDDRDPLAPLADGLITLSLLPKSRWCNLHNLDIIKERNKPKEPPKQLKAAPFFLPTTPGLVPKFLPADQDIPVEESAQSKFVQLSKLQPLSEFQKCLKDCAQSKQFTPLMDYMKAMGPSALDGECSSLSPEGGGSLEQLASFMRFLLSELKRKENFELVEAYLSLFMKHHSTAVSQEPLLRELAKDLLAEHKSAWQQIHTDLNYCSCLVQFCKTATV